MKIQMWLDYENRIFLGLVLPQLSYTKLQALSTDINKLYYLFVYSDTFFHVAVWLNKWDRVLLNRMSYELFPNLSWKEREELIRKLNLTYPDAFTLERGNKKLGLVAAFYHGPEIIDHGEVMEIERCCVPNRTTTSHAPVKRLCFSGLAELLAARPPK